jgi:hypothetical protein
LQRYSENAARGEDPDLHKAPEWLAPQLTGPWGAFDLTLGKAIYAGFTVGATARVTRAAGNFGPHRGGCP